MLSIPTMSRSWSGLAITAVVAGLEETDVVLDADDVPHD
jgi:hypothetical protein